MSDSLFFEVHKCQGRVECKSEEEIEAYLENLTLTILMKNNIFTREQYDDMKTIQSPTKAYFYNIKATQTSEYQIEL